MAGRSTQKSQGWIGALVVGGLLLFATTFLGPSSVTRQVSKRQKTERDQPSSEFSEPVLTRRLTTPVSRMEQNEARALLSRVAATYQQARSYRDRTIMQLVRRDDPTRQLDKAEMIVEFERPNRIRIDVQRDHDQLLLLSDGSQMFARIIDPGTNNFDNQLVVKPSPTALSVQALYELCEYVRFDQPDQRFSALMSLPAPLLVSQLSLLLDSQAMTQLMEHADRIELLPEHTYRGLPSQRVRLSTPGGIFVLWIDPYASQLQRIEFPTPDAYRLDERQARGESTDAQVGETVREHGALALVAEFRDRRFDTTLRETSFELPISSASQPVRHFVLPPVDGSADLLGRVRQGYWFTDLYGDRRHDRDWDGQITVMVWFSNHPASRAVLQEVQQAADHHASDERMQFLAICVEPSTRLSHRQVDQLLRSWSIRLPALRDFDAFGRDVFRVDQAPTLVVVDATGRVQLVEVGGSSDLDEQLSTVLDRLIAGEDLAQRYLDHLAQQREVYVRLLKETRQDASALDRSSGESLIQ